MSIAMTIRHLFEGSLNDSMRGIEDTRRGLAPDPRFEGTFNPQEGVLLGLEGQQDRVLIAVKRHQPSHHPRSNSVRFRSTSTSRALAIRSKASGFGFSTSGGNHFGCSFGLICRSLVGSRSHIG